MMVPLVKFRDISNQSGLELNIENWEQHLTDSESFTQEFLGATIIMMVI